MTTTAPATNTAATTTPAGPPSARRRRDERAVAFFGTWMIFGLFLDGWAHQAQKPETFFSPWHGILYSGFVAAVAWFAWDGWRTRSAAATTTDRWMTAGLALFVTGAVGDGVWHEIFGIEVDLEALLSPTHLLLLIGGFLLVTSPLRAALGDTTEREPTWTAWWPQAVTLTLTTALVGFFTMYLSAFHGVGGEGRGPFGEVLQANGIARVLLTNALLIVPVLLVLRRWRPPAGTFLLLFTGVAVAMAGLEGFRLVELVAPAVLAGLTAEALTRGRRHDRPGLVAGIVSFVWWASFFAVADATYGIRWTVELWSGTIVLAAASSVLLAAVHRPLPE